MKGNHFESPFLFVSIRIVFVPIRLQPEADLPPQLRVSDAMLIASSSRNGRGGRRIVSKFCNFFWVGSKLVTTRVTPNGLSARYRSPADGEVSGWVGYHRRALPNAGDRRRSGAPRQLFSGTDGRKHHWGLRTRREAAKQNLTRPLFIRCDNFLPWCVW